jgi:putative transposase
MRAHALQERHQRLYQATTDSRHALPVADNMLARDFSPGGPHQVWTADTPYLGTDEGWRYLAIVLDRFNREVMGWSLKPRMTADRVTDALNLAGFRRQPPGFSLTPTEAAHTPAAPAKNTLQAYGRVGSMSNQGNCGDHAPTESGCNRFKLERVFGKRFLTREAMKATAFAYIEGFYNRRRLHSTLGYASSVQYQQHWREAQLAEHQVA